MHFFCVFLRPKKVQRNQQSAKKFATGNPLNRFFQFAFLFLGIIHDHGSINENVVQLVILCDGARPSLADASSKIMRNANKLYVLIQLKKY